MRQFERKKNWREGLLRNDALNDSAQQLLQSNNSAPNAGIHDILLLKILIL